MRKRRIVIMLVAVLVLVGGIAGWWVSRPAPSENHLGMGTKIAHAAIGDKKGCATCHAAAIAYTTCSDAGCHAALAAPYTITPTTMLINFPHHNTGNAVGATSDCQSCHATVPNDARYIGFPAASHSGQCATCHGETHS